MVLLVTARAYADDPKDKDKDKDEKPAETAKDKPVSPNKLIEDVLEMIAYPLRTSNVKVITHFSPKLPPVDEGCYVHPLISRSESPDSPVALMFLRES